MPKRKALTEQQRLFAKYFATLDNASEAARKAGYAPKTAGQAGHRLLRDAEIMRLVALHRQNIRAADVITEERILEEVGAIAFSDPRQMFDKDGRLLDPPEWPDGVARSVASFRVRATNEGKARIVDVKLIDKTASLKMLGQEHRMFADRVEHTHKHADMTLEELQAELDRVRGEAQEIAESYEQRGLAPDGTALN